MSCFVDYERTIIEKLLTSVLSAPDVSELLENAELASLELTGCGYFLTVRHPRLPQERVVCDDPILNGNTGKIECGFVVFIERGELTLECYSYGDDALPSSIRELPMRITVDKSKRDPSS